MHAISSTPASTSRLLALIAGVALLAGCSAPANATPTATPSASPSASAAAASGATGTPATTATPTPSGVSAQIAPALALAGNACTDWTLVRERSVVAITGNSSQLRRSMPLFLEDVAKFQKTVPAAQRADVEVFANTWNAIGRELVRIDYDLLLLATDNGARTATQGIGTPQMVAAQNHLDAWAKATCPPAAVPATPAR